MPKLHALPKRRNAQTDTVQRVGERIIQYGFYDAAGPPCSEQTSGRRRAFSEHGAALVLMPDTLGAFRHDFRRTVVRNLERSCVARSVAMELVGHKTESVYQCYDIVAERDLAEGVARYAARAVR